MISPFLKGLLFETAAAEASCSRATESQEKGRALVCCNTRTSTAAVQLKLLPQQTICLAFGAPAL